MQLKVSEGDFIQFTQHIMTFFEELAQSRDIILSYNYTIDSVQAWFDKNLLEKVYFNLLSNAFKNVPNGGSIAVSVDRMSGDELTGRIPDGISPRYFKNDIQYLMLEIKDSGAGISPDELENIFIPFYQIAQNEHSSSGTGLGLSLSRSIIEMHHGVIWAESREGEGATFKCVLPVCKECFSAEHIMEKDPYYNSIFMDKIEVPEVMTDDGKKGKLYTILVVEDNLDVRQYIISNLSDTYHIIEASNGKEGIEKAITHLPDLIISDLMMPKMDGMEMCAEIKADLRTSHIPVIMLTAKTMNEDIEEGYKIGADDYITKPFNAAVLTVRVENIIRSRIKLKELYGKRFTLDTLGVEAVSVDEQFLQKLYAIMEKNISNPELNLDSFSQDIGMSRTNFYRKIKALTNLSPGEFIRNFRLTMAAKILKEARLPISEVYVAVGFNSHAYFSNCFKTFYGMSPTEYIKKEAD